MSDSEDWDEEDMQAIVIDNGSATIKAGFSGDDKPISIFPSTVGRVNDIDTISSTTTQNIFVGIEAEQQKDTLNIKYPIQHGIVTSWDDMEKIWHHTFYNELKIAPEERCVLATEAPLTPKINREKTLQIMFETFNVPGLYIGAQPMLSLMASRLIKNVDKILTGAVIEAGVDVTHVIPIVDGNVIDACIKQLPLGGRSITKFILQMLRDRGEQIPLQCAASVARQIKETYCYCCADIVKEYARYDRDETRFQVYNGKH
eukprot:88650_1